MMQFYTDAQLFLNDHLAFLCQNESEYNLMIGLLTRFSKANKPLFGFSFEDSNCKGMGIQTSPETELILTRFLINSLAKVVNLLKENRSQFQSVYGESETSFAFANLWTSSPVLKMRQGVYELTSVKMPDLKGGYLRQAHPSDLEQITPWVEGFIKECFVEEDHAVDAFSKMAKRLILRESLFIWFDCHQEPVAMAANNRQSPQGASISYVYTPPELRGQGHGGRVTAALSQHLLDSGKIKCNLHTDLNNPVSNRIYQKIGYYPVAENKVFKFLGDTHGVD